MAGKGSCMDGEGTWVAGEGGKFAWLFPPPHNWQADGTHPTGMLSC